MWTRFPLVAALIVGHATGQQGSCAADEACDTTAVWATFDRTAQAVELMYPFDGDVLSTPVVQVGVRIDAARCAGTDAAAVASAPSAEVCLARWSCGEAPCAAFAAAASSDGDRDVALPLDDAAWRWCGPASRLPNFALAKLLANGPHHAVGAWLPAPDGGGGDGAPAPRCRGSVVAFSLLKDPRDVPHAVLGDAAPKLPTALAVHFGEDASIASSRGSEVRGWGSVSRRCGRRLRSLAL